MIGLGRFGTALALELVDTGHEVLGIDNDEAVVQKLSTAITQTVQADSTSSEALAEIDIQNFDRVVVAIGTNIESSILTTSLLLEIGIKEIWAKADTEAHGRILQQLGVHHVVFPESDMGRRIAHQVGGDQEVAGEAHLADDADLVLFIRVVRHKRRRGESGPPLVVSARVAEPHPEAIWDSGKR